MLIAAFVAAMFILNVAALATIAWLYPAHAALTTAAVVVSFLAYESGRRCCAALRKLLAKPPGSEWHVYKIGDYYCWLARSLEEAKRDYANEFGEEMQADCEWSCRQLSASELASRMFTYQNGTDALDRPVLAKRTFQQQLDIERSFQRANGGNAMPYMFSVDGNYL